MTLAVVEPTEDEDKVNQIDTIFITLLMLPYANWWQILQCLGVCISCLYATFNITYYFYERFTYEIVFPWGYAIIEILFAFDTLMLLLNRNIKAVRKRMYQQQQHAFILVICMISVIPIAEIYEIRDMLMWKNTTENVTTFRIYATTKVYLRLVKVIVFYFKMRSEAGLNQLLVVCIGQVILLILLSNFFGALWYLTLTNTEYHEWTSELQDYEPLIPPATNFTIDKFFIAYTTMANLLAHNWSGSINVKDVSPNVLIILAMLFGHILHTMVTMGLMTVTYMNKQKKQIDFSQKIKIILKFMKTGKVKHSLIEDTRDFYNELWEKRAGVKSMPECFDLLPLSLRKEVTVDIFWDMFQHSHLFAHMDMAIKREVSLVMKTEFLLPGDYLYRFSKNKMKMVFIVSGVIQVLSDDDDDSPLLSLSGGSLLGEYCLLYGDVSNANLRSATYCEIQVLYSSDLYRTLQNYRSRTRILQSALKRRIEKARKMEKVREEEKEAHVSHIFGHTLQTSMRRFKKHWRSVYNLEMDNRAKYKGVGDIQIEVKRGVNKVISSHYLDLIVLSNEIELKVQAIFLKGNFPFVLDPDSGFHYFIEYMSLTAVICQYFILPYYIFFEKDAPLIVLYLMLILDTIYVIDILVQVSTAIKKKNHLVTDSMAILIGRFKNLYFIIDVIATSPLDTIAFWLGYSVKISMYLKLPRLLKVYKLIFLIKRKEQELQNDTVYVRLLKYVIIFVCLVYFISCMFIITYPVTNRLINQSRELISTYQTMNAYSTVGLVERQSYNISSLIIMHIVTMVSYYMAAFCFAELTSLEILLDRIDKIHKTFLTALKKYMTMRVFPIDISVRLVQMIKFQWNYSNNSEFLGQNSIISDAPVNIQKNVIGRKIRKYLSNMTILQGLNDDIIKYIFHTARFFAFNPGATIVEHNTRSAYMYIIIKGFCNIESDVPGDRERGLKTSIKKAGDCFPVVEVLHDVNTLIRVTTVTAVETLMLPAFTFRKIMKSYPHVFVDIHKSLKSHELVFGSILHRLEHKVPLLTKPFQRSLGPGEYFHYNPNEITARVDKMKLFLKPYNALGILSLIRYFALRNSINPYGVFYKYWETFHCICALTHFILIICFMNVLYHYSKEISLVFHVLNVLAYADLYVRCHCQFYDDNGILVTHPLATAKHYFKNGFGLDFFGVLPFDYVYLHHMFDDASAHSVLAVMYLLTRPFQLYRVFQFTFRMLKRNRRISESYLYYFRTALAIAAALLVLSSLTQLLICWGTTLEKLNCQSEGWIGIREGHYVADNYISMLASLHLILSIYTASCCGTFDTVTYKDLVYLLILIPILTILRWVSIAKLTSLLIESETTLTKSQNDMKRYLNFVKSESISGHIVSDLVDHYEHEVAKDHNTRLASISYKFSPQLHEDIAYYDYGRALLESAILRDVEPSIVKYLSTMFSRHFIKKDSQIIRCNDVNDRLYFIWRGKVDIMIANCKVATLGHGGMFGCLAKRGYTRQTIAAVAKIHVELVSIKSDLFYELTEQYPIIKSRIENWLATNIEYTTAAGVSAAIIKITRGSGQYGIAKYKWTWHTWINRIFNQQRRWYKIADYVLNVHLASLSSIVVIGMQALNSDHIFKFDVTLLVLAGVFCIKIFLGFHLTYDDTDSGITVTSKKKICRKYLKGEFLVDFVGVLPIQLFSRYVDLKMDYAKLIYSNYLLRFMFLIRYYKLRKNKLNVERHLQWTFLLYVAVFSIQVMTYFWKLLACHRGGCKYIYKNVVYLDNNTLYSTILSYTYLTNIFASTGLTHIRPITVPEMGMSIFILIICFILSTNLTAGFATSFMVTSYASSNFDHEIESIKCYFNGQNLSPPIIKKVWTYYLEMWQRQSGQWTPSVIKDAPGYLQQNLLQELYGYHLSNHILFRNTHVDFLRQLVAHCKRCVYLPGYSIVEAGDVDNTMYFVHSGEVEITFGYIDAADESTHGQFFVKEGGSFGVEQGLLNTPHTHTYKAYTVVDIITLNYKHWQHLIPWFPASHEEIIATARNNYLVKFSSLITIPNN